MKLGSEEEAQALYDRGIDTGVGVFCSKLGVADAYRESFRQVYMDMLGKVRYTVDHAEKQSDGSYVVTVTYEKMNIQSGLGGGTVLFSCSIFTTNSLPQYSHLITFVLFSGIVSVAPRKH